MYANPEEVFGGTSKLLALIELIYSAVDDISLWPDVLDRMAAALNGVETLIWTNFSSGPEAANIVSMARMDAAALDPYARHYGRLNVLAQRCDALVPDGQARFGHRAMAYAEFEKTEFCNDYFHPHRMHHTIGVKVPLGGGMEPAYIACMRPKDKDIFEDREGTILETLVPHLQRALMLHLKMSQLRLNAEGLETGLDLFGHAVFGLNCGGRVVVSNRQAEKLAASGDGLRLAGGCLAATYPEENRLLQAQLSVAVAAGARAGIGSGGSLTLSRRAGHASLRITVIPYQSNWADHYGQLAALVFVSDPEAATLPRSAVLHSFYGLTPTEARIADLLASGNEVREVALRVGITLETARFYVKRVLAKTGTRRQTELIRLMLSLPGR